MPEEVKDGWRFLHAPLGEVTAHSIGEIKNIMVDKIEDIESPLAHMIPEGAGNVVLPAVSIDPENEHLIQNAISELTRGKTIITIAHRLATIENADRILVVDDGKIVQRGTHQELMKQEGRYRSFVETRERAEDWKIA